MSADLEHIRQIMREADCLYTEAEVEVAIARVGAQITAEMAETNPVVFCVMNGGLKVWTRLAIMFLVDQHRGMYLTGTRVFAEINNRAQGMTFIEDVIDDQHMTVDK